MNRDDVTPAWQSAVNACLETLSRTPSDGYADQKPDVAWRLTRQWWAMTAAYKPEGLPGTDQYLECLTAARPQVLDFPGSDVTEILSEGKWEEPSVEDVPADPTDPKQWGNENWQRYLAVEADYEAADWGCRKDVYETYIDGLLPMIEAFATAHSTEISLARQEWAEVGRQAGHLGYQGQPGPLGK